MNVANPRESSEQRLRLLKVLIVVLSALWFSLVILGLIQGAYIDPQAALVMGAYLVVILLSLALLVLRAPCACPTPLRRRPIPSSEGLAAGAILYLLGAIVLGGMALPTLEVAETTQYLLLWIVGISVGIAALILLIAGWFACRFRFGDKARDHGRNTLPIPDNVWLRPDPWLYSQQWARSIGVQPVWDNPSVTIIDPTTNLEVAPKELSPSTLYRFFVEIQNGSAATPAPVSAAGTELTIELRQFGIGGGHLEWIIPSSGPLIVPLIPKTPRSATDPSSVQIVQKDWISPANPGSYCAIFSVHHPDDANPLNNVGQHNLGVVKGAAGQTVTTEIALWNRAPRGPKSERVDRMAARRTNSGILQIVRRVLSPLLWVWALPYRFYAAHRLKARKTGPNSIPTGPTKELVTVEVSDGAPNRGIPPSGWRHELDATILEIWPESSDAASPQAATVSLSIGIPRNSSPGEVAAFQVSGLLDESLIGGVTILAKVEES
ncbi:hypothetical protein [Pleomorphovibrio marinus]|uniref:hypothetical protein n=1 Tax=Pleomorphovibrio marinus TaxID=2164132 RepID=UPI000E0A1CB8|nr:hypothetical protein [Pleomorphovibrio marinus]